jgi:fatty acid desaturase
MRNCWRAIAKLRVGGACLVLVRRRRRCDSGVAASFWFLPEMTISLTRPRRRPVVEWPTLGLALLIYGGWLGLTWFWRELPPFVLVPLAGWVVAWHGSLQHEAMHGHPTTSRAFNSALAWPPLSLWLPYPVYRLSHLVHHRDEYLTDPIEDPESSYLTGADWARMPRPVRLVFAWNQTLLGRLLVGPAIMIGLFLWDEAKRVVAGEPGRRRIWLVHGLCVAVLLVWVAGVCAMPVWLYLAAFVYGGASLTRLRSFAEHRWAERAEERTAIVENGGLLGLLYLNNNLHVLHHQRPAVAWYRLPALYRAEREALVAANGGLVYAGYQDIVRRYWRRQHDRVTHPRHP